MSKRLTVDLEDNEYLALEHTFPDPREWLVTFVSETASNRANEMLTEARKHPQFAGVLTQKQIGDADYAALWDAAVEFLTAQPGYKNAARRKEDRDAIAAETNAARDALLEEQRLDRERHDEEARLEFEKAEAREAQRLELIARVADLEAKVKP